MTAITAAMRGLRAVLYLTGHQPPSWPKQRSRTLAIAATVTATTRSRPAWTNCARAEVPYLNRLGGSTAPGAAAYATAVPQACRPARRPAGHPPGGRCGLTRLDGRRRADGSGQPQRHRPSHGTTAGSGPRLAMEVKALLGL